MIDVRFQRGLHLPEPDLWLDPWDAKPHAFVSHAHADHFAKHESILCSEVTAILLRKRFHVSADNIEALPFHVPLVRNGFRLRMLPAGHIPGSAMLHVTRIKDNATLLYTGDFKTRRGRTAEAVNFLAADTLVLETTFGLPQYELPNPMEVESAVLRFVHDAFADGAIPILLAYALGKSQEALALLAEHDIPALLHPGVAEMTHACREAGVELPEPVVFDGNAPPGHAIIAPPAALRSRVFRDLKNKRTAMLTGWALDPDAKHRYQVDEVIPFSDHADHPGLLECIQRVRPKRVLTVHGFAKEFAAELRGRRIDAWCAMGGDQMELAIQQQALPRAGSGIPRHIRAICALADFSDLCRLVGETSSRVAKSGFIANYLKSLEPDHDLRLSATWLAGKPLPTRPPLHLNAAAIERALLALPGIREERYREISAGKNSISRTARLLLQEITLQPQPLDLPGLEQFLLGLASEKRQLVRIQLLASRLSTLHPMEGETIIKLLVGDLQIGLTGDLLEEAIAAAFQVDPEKIRHAHTLTGDIGETALLARNHLLDEAAIRPLVPVKCMPASPLKRSGPFPFPPPLWLEPAYKGIRAQLHKSGKSTALFSGNLRPLDHDFPEIPAAARELPGDFILDGILIGGPLESGKKTKIHPQMDRDLFQPIDSQPLHPATRFIVFDLLWHQGEDLTGLSLIERRTRLETLPLHPPLETGAIFAADHHEETGSIFKQALHDGHESLIAKDPSSLYTPGHSGQSWLELHGLL